jgi:hypothetical protein
VNRFLLLAFIATHFVACSQFGTHEATGSRREQLICLVRGYDSLIYYVGTGDNFQKVKRGKRTDTPFEAIQSSRQPPKPFKLELPKDDPDTADPENRLPLSALVILIAGDPNPYIYHSNDIGNGKLRSYPEIKQMLIRENVDTNFLVLIKTDIGASYKNIVDMLDLMKTTNVKHYALPGMTKKEDSYLHRLKL